MTTKTWTAHDLELGKLTIIRGTFQGVQGPALQIERRYQFLDDQGQVLEGIAGGRVVEVIAIADVPASVLSALQDIDTWTKNQALIQEGMD